MRIVFDGRWIGRTGIGRYAEELLNELQKLDTVNHYFVLLLPQTYDTWKPAAANFEAVRTTYEVYTWQEQFLLGAQISQLKPDLVHFTSFNLPIFYSGRFVTTIHDLTLVHFKNARGGALKRLIYDIKYWAMRGIMRVVTRRADAGSASTRPVGVERNAHAAKTMTSLMANLCRVGTDGGASYRSIICW